MNEFTKEEINLLKQMQNNPSSKCNIKRMLKKRNPQLLQKIINKTLFLKDNASMNERLYCIFNDLHSIPLCAKCHKNHVKFSTKGNYSTYCSLSCAISVQMSKQAKEHINIEQARKTRLERYGSYHASNFGQRVKETKLKNHGNENYVNVEKAEKTKLEKYGNAHFVNLEKRLKTNEEKYGNPFYNNSEKISETKQTFTDKKNSEINLKRKQTNLERYGVENVLQDSAIIEKLHQTNLERYGVKSVLQLKSIHDKRKKIVREQAYENMLLKVNEYEPLFTKDEFLTADLSKTYFKWKHKVCGEIVEGRYCEGKIIAHCRKCYPYGSSIGEKELYEYIRLIYNGDIICNDRSIIKPRELDIYIPEKKLAIEFDGLYWHSEKHGTDKNNLLQKTIDCEAKGIKLIHVFEDEWIYSKEIVKSRISNLLGFSEKLYARNCELKDVSFNDAKKFLEENHIQGNCPAKIRLGLYYDNILVSLMTFGKPRFSNKYDWELLRFCNCLRYTIIGAASKLLKHFENQYHPKTIISYADRRWSNGNLYVKLNFKKISNGKPNYWYFNTEYKRLSRILFQKHKLKMLLENFDPSKSEAENMIANGYNRIFDCGNLAFIKEYTYL